jgi:hypothetical protein
MRPCAQATDFAREEPAVREAMMEWVVVMGGV